MIDNGFEIEALPATRDNFISCARRWRRCTLCGLDHRSPFILKHQWKLRDVSRSARIKFLRTATFAEGAYREATTTRESFEARCKFFDLRELSSGCLARNIPISLVFLVKRITRNFFQKTLACLRAADSLCALHDTREETAGRENQI